MSTTVVKKPDGAGSIVKAPKRLNGREKSERSSQQNALRVPSALRIDLFNISPYA